MTRIAKLLSLTLTIPFAAGCDISDELTPPERNRDAEVADGDDQPVEAAAAKASKADGESCDKGSIETKVSGMLSSLDVDEDGTVSTTEANQTWLSARFARVDANVDGQLTQRELVEFKKTLHVDDGVSADVIEEHVTKMFASLDSDQGGTLSAAETRQTWLGARFELADANRDGLLAPAELVEYKKTLHVDDGVTAEVIEEHVAKMFATRDSDDDGVLSATEANQTGLHVRFRRTDTDGDGQLSRAELAELVVAQHSQQGECDGG